MDSKQLALKCRELADDKKAENLVILDVRKLSSVTDYFIIATGTSAPHLRAVVDEIEDGLKRDFALRPRTREGGVGEAWIVLDYFDVIVHVMRGDVRDRFDLEGLWCDAQRIEPGAVEPVPMRPLKPKARRIPSSKPKTDKPPSRRRIKPPAADAV